MKVGLICSSGGSSFFSAVDILVKLEFIRLSDIYVITDRQCAAEQACSQRGIKFTRIEEDSNDIFSEKALELFRQNGVTVVFLLFLRIINEVLYKNLVVLNIHPSLLPAFKGFNAVEQCLESGSRYLGCTLHMATRIADSGAVISQVVSPVDFDDDIDSLNKKSYLQKTYLILGAVDMIGNQSITFSINDGSFIFVGNPQSHCSANPAIKSVELSQAFREFQEQSGQEAIAL